MAFNIGNSFGLIPAEAKPNEYMNDMHPYWSQEFLAQTGLDSNSQSANGDMTDNGTSSLI